MAHATRAGRARPKTAGTKHAARAAGGREGHGDLWGLGLCALGLFLAVVLWLGVDGGVVGDKVSVVVETLVGSAAVLLPAALVAVGVLLVVRSSLLDLRPFRSGLIAVGLAILLACGGGLFGIGPESDARASFDLDRLRDTGGVFGGTLAVGVEKAIGGAGLTILTTFALIAGVLLVSGASARVWLDHSAKAGSRVARHTARAARSTARHTASAVRAASAALPTAERPRRPPVDAEREYADLLTAPPAPEAASQELPPLLVDQLHRDLTAAEPAALDTSTEDEAPPTQERLFEAPPPPGDYRLPDRGLLRRSRQHEAQPARAAERTAEVLVETLRHFGIEATVVGQVSGPRVTRYELTLAPGTKVSRVSALRDDLAYALATTEIRILAPIPGKQAVGVEVPNLSPNLVTLGDILDEGPQNASPLTVWLGKDISGASVSADLARMPHVLIAGTTGSGKSGCINTMLCSILMRATPDEVRMILVDPKRVELGLYESIPHLLTPVVSSPKRAAAVLANVTEEMERRYERMSLARARNLAELNRSLGKRGEARVPYLLVVIDELADLMMISPQEVEDSVIRLAQKSRAVGIHLVLATQRPSVDVITGMIKANVPSRIAFAVSSQTDSRVILDQAGAETLLGQGDMLFKPLGTSRLQRVQGAYVSEEEIALVVEQCRSQRDQDLDESLLKAPERDRDGGDAGDEDFDPDEDPLLEKAIEIVVQTQTASVSLIQRRLRVGYTRAGRLVDMLERRGVISGYEGSKPRRVLVSEADLDQVLASVAER
jgi:S-DNA-T family DNA segregation ATPase FtsK/SpoIIIE